MGQLRDIRLYMFLRLLVLFSVLASLMLYQGEAFLDESTTSKTYLVTFFTFLVTTAFIFLYERAIAARYFLASQIAYDILFTTVLIYYAGPRDTMYIVFYFFNIIFAALLFRGRGALMAALASGALYVVVMRMNSTSFTGEKFFSTLTTVTALIAIALLSGQLLEELRKSQQRVSRLEQLSEEIVDSLDSGLLGLDPDGLIKKINRTAQSLLGIESAGAIIDRPFRDVLPAVGDIQNIRGSRMQEISVGGRQRRMLVTRVDLPDKHSMILLRDLSEVLDLEEKMRRQERLAGVGRLAAGVAHEIRNPVGAISGAAQLLQSHPASKDEESRLLAIITRESERVDRLVAQLLRFAKPSVVERKPVQLSAVVRESLDSVKTRPEFLEMQVEFAVEVPDALVVRGSPDQLMEVVTNLLVNAMQAFSEAERRRGNKLSVRGRAVNGHVEIVVADNGPGIPREFRSRIFDPFFTTKPNGTGLGLAQVHKIVREHDGFVDVETEEGKGTALKIRLPV